jgi:hypothetical protein
MAESQGLLSKGLSMVRRNKRYIVWFYVLNLALAFLGTAGFNDQAQPDFGSVHATAVPATHFALLFFILTALFLPGVLQGYASTYRLPREDFFRACGRNLWRFIRLLFVAGIVMGVVAVTLFGLHGLLEKKAAESTNELLLPEVRLAGLAVIFLVMTALRIWFDLAQTDLVLSDRRAVRKSIGASFRHTWRNLGRLLASYAVITIVAAIILGVGLLLWLKFVPPASVIGAVFVSQLTLLLLLIPRFWQRGVAVTYYLQGMVEPIAVQPFSPVAAIAPAVSKSASAPALPIVPPEPQGS